MTAYSLRDAEISEAKTTDRRGKAVVKRQLQIKSSYRIGEGNWRALAMAGDVVYAGENNAVACFDVQSAAQAKGAISPLWRAEIEGTPVSMIAGDGRLFVVTSDAKVFCFGEDEVEAKTYSPRKEAIPEAEEHWRSIADVMLEGEGSREGYAIAFGVETGQLIDELLRRTSLQIVVVDDDETKVEG